MELLGITNCTQQYELRGYQIRVTRGPDPDYAAISIVQGGAVYFEFFASGKPVYSEFVTDPISGTIQSYMGATVGVDVGVTVGGVVSASPQILKGKRFVDTSQASAIGQAMQVNMANEPNACVTTTQVASSGDFSRLLYESWSPMHSNTGVFLQHYCRAGTVDGGFASNIERDVTYDVPWADSQGKNKLRYCYLLGSADWPRASGIQKVKDDVFGEREFAIYVDAFSQFWVFPTSQIITSGDNAQTVDAQYVKGFRPAFPDWVYMMTEEFKEFYGGAGDTGLLSFPDTDWKLHPDGTKACAVVWKQTDIDYDADYFAGLPGAAGDPESDFGDVKAEAGYSQAAGFIYPGSDSADKFLLANGLLEVGIEITLTGTNPGDYELAGTTSVVRDPEESETGTVVAGYVWHDIPSPFTNGVLCAKRGDLCVLDMELYFNPTNEVVSGLGPLSGLYLLPMVKNLTQAQDIIPLNFVRCNDFDMKTLSFAGQMQTASQYSLAIPLRADYPPSDGHSHAMLPSTTTATFTVAHPQVQIITFAKVREMLYPPGIPDEQKLTISQQTPAAARAGYADLTFVPLNDTTPWSDWSNVRLWVAHALGYTTSTPTLNTAEEAFYAQVLSNLSDLIFIQNPRFGFYQYAMTTMQWMRKHPRSVFFSHPNGTWAYFDTSIIYNKNGITLPRAFYNTLSMFDESLLSVAVFDRIHFELPGLAKTGLDSTFIGLYNAALTGSKGANKIDDTFSALASSDFVPAFTKEQYDYTIVGGLDDGKVVSWLQLKAEYPNGNTYYIYDPGYIDGQSQQEGVAYGFESTGSVSTFGGGNLFDQSLDAAWTTGAGYTGFVSPPTIDFGRCAFATPTLIVS